VQIQSWLFLPEYGGCMKICQVVLLLTLGAGAVLKAQTLPAGMTLSDGATLPGGTTPPAGTVMVASETMPGGVAFFPELVASSHPALLQGLPMTPSISQGLPATPVTTETEPKPLTGMDRLTLFWNESYASPGAFVGVSAGALVDQLRHTPAKWDGDGSAYTRRFASEYGQLATRNVIHDGLAGITGLDPRYVACKCQGTLRRSGHALKMTFITYRKDGQLSLDVPQLASAYGSGMISTYWYPHNQFSPLVQGVQFGHEQMGEILIGNMVHEFGPDLERHLHLHALTARRHPRPDDD
jgi:hypothetical protein